MGRHTQEDAVERLGLVARALGSGTLKVRGDIIDRTQGVLGTRAMLSDELRACIHLLLDGYQRQGALLKTLLDARHAGDAQAALSGLLAPGPGRAFWLPEDHAAAALHIADAMAKVREARAPARSDGSKKPGLLESDPLRKVIAKAVWGGKEFELVTSITRERARIGFLKTRADGRIDEDSIGLTGDEAQTLFNELAEFVQ
jgi:hypothetical protein